MGKVVVTAIISLVLAFGLNIVREQREQDEALEMPGEEAQTCRMELLFERMMCREIMEECGYVTRP